MPSSFLQSPEWEEFQRSLGRATSRESGILFIRHLLPMGRHYLYCPRPVVSAERLMRAQVAARAGGAVFLKIDPSEISFSSVTQAPAGRTIQPRQTVVMDLTKSEESLLAAMHGKTRYNIRLAARKGVSIRQGRSRAGEVETFWRLLQETAARDGFRTHPRAYYEKLLAVNSDRFSNELFFAEYNGNPVAAALINFYRDGASGGCATYLHGASSREYKEVAAPQLLHWHIVEEARRRGFYSYDFWGIDAARWPGLTRFKQGFGGAAVTYPPSIEIAYRPVSYAAYRLWKRFWRR